MKTTRILSASGVALLSTTFLFALAPASRAADLVYNLTLNLNSLAINPNGPFSLDLQLVQGSGNVTNKVTLSNFVFTGGSPTGTPDFTSGNETGSLASSIVLTNTASDNEFAQAFSSGTTQLSFKVDETSNSELVGSGTPIPDQFNVAILDNGLNNIPTTDPSGGNTLVSSAIAANQTLASVDAYSSLSPDAGVTVNLSATPEPRSGVLGLLAACVMAGMLVMRRRRVA